MTAGPARNSGGTFSWLEIAIITLLGLLFNVVWTLWIGQDINWDQRNYHIYVVYSWLHPRDFVDIAPAQLQTWSNPLPHILSYAAITLFPPRIASAAIGTLSGFNFALVYIITRLILVPLTSLWTKFVSFSVALLGITASAFLSEVGTTFIDDFTSTFVLLCLALVLRVATGSGKRFVNLMAIEIGGLSLGLAVGMKLTNGIYALPLLLLTPFLLWRVLGFAAPLAFYASSFVGFVLSAGAWCLALWQHFRNPLFPYFNHFFRSPFYDPTNFKGVQVLPKGLLDALSYPYKWFSGVTFTSELPFSDSRFLIVFPVLIFTGFVLSIRYFRDVACHRRLPQFSAVMQQQAFVVAFFLLSFLLWMFMFGLQRYLVVVELLTGVVLIISLQALTNSIRVITVLMIVTTSFSIWWSRPIDWWRLPYSESWYGMRIPERLLVPGTLFVMIGDGHPYSYIIPYFPSSDRFIRLTGNMVLMPSKGFGILARTAIHEHPGPVRAIAPTTPSPGDLATLAAFGLGIDQSDCIEFTSNFDRFTSCSLVRNSLPR